MNLKSFRRLHLSEAGMGLIEVLVAITLFAIASVALTKSAIVSIEFQKRTEISNLAKNLAVSKAEELSGVQNNLLNSSYSGSEVNMAVAGHAIRFTRTTTVSTNADGSKTIVITVSSASPLLSKPITYSTRFAPWES